MTAIAIVCASISAALLIAWVHTTAVRKSVSLLLFATTFVYVQTVWTGAYVGDVPLAFRVFRDSLLTCLLIGLYSKRSSIIGLERAVSVTCVGTASWITLRHPSTQAITQIRYYALMPLLGVVVASALIRKIGRAAALLLVARIVIAVGVISALLGLGQTAALLPTGYYNGYVAYGLTRSVGLVGQPNNQAFLLCVAFAAVRFVNGAAPKRAIPLLYALMGVSLLATFSRTGLLGLLVILSVQVPEQARPWGRRRRRGAILLIPVVLLLVPIAFGYRASPGGGGKVRFTASSVASDKSGVTHLSFAPKVIRSLGVSGVLLGDPSLHSSASPESNSVATDNLILDMLIAGGLPLVGFWAWAALRILLVKSPREYVHIRRGFLGLVGMFSVSSASFGLFPGISFVWVIMFLATTPDARTVAISEGAAPGQLPRQRTDIGHAHPSMSSEGGSRGRLPLQQRWPA